MKDLTGLRFGKWVVIEFAGRGPKSNTRWLCRCDCGNERVVLGGNLGRGESTQCAKCARTKHGANRQGARTPEYTVWAGVVRRCTNPNYNAYRHYGGRGITICDRWMGEHGFENFLADMGPRPSLGHEIDRINNNGNYEPSNCRWATRREQMRNMRRNRVVVFGGASATVAEWADRLGINKGTLDNRLRRGWPIDRALTEPVHAKGAAA